MVDVTDGGDDSYVMIRWLDVTDGGDDDSYVMIRWLMLLMMVRIVM